MTIIRRNQTSIAAKDAELFELLKKEAVLSVNTAVGKIRTQFITDIPGQEMIYQMKEQEARRYVAANPEPMDLTDYPLIEAEVGITAPTAYQLAQVWLNMAGMLLFIGSKLEGIRTAANGMIESSANDTEIQNALDYFKTALGVLGFV